MAGIDRDFQFIGGFHPMKIVVEVSDEDKEPPVSVYFLEIGVSASKNFLTGMINTVRTGVLWPHQLTTEHIFWHHREITSQGTSAKGSFKKVFEEQCGGVMDQPTSVHDLICGAAGRRHISSVFGHALCSTTGNDKWMTLGFKIVHDTGTGVPEIYADVVRYDHNKKEKFRKEMNTRELIVSQIAFYGNDPGQLLDSSLSYMFAIALINPMQRRILPVAHDLAADIMLNPDMNHQLLGAWGQNGGEPFVEIVRMRPGSIVVEGTIVIPALDAVTLAGLLASPQLALSDVLDGYTRATLRNRHQDAFLKDMKVSAHVEERIEAGKHPVAVLRAVFHVSEICLTRQGDATHALFTNATHRHVVHDMHFASIACDLIADMHRNAIASVALPPDEQSATEVSEAAEDSSTATDKPAVHETSPATGDTDGSFDDAFLSLIEQNPDAIYGERKSPTDDVDVPTEEGKAESSAPSGDNTHVPKEGDVDASSVQLPEDDTLRKPSAASAVVDDAVSADV
eukprot:m.202579 g.202579  ORF g.202579 m.202579 type:complete len:511 (+) comp18838_c0_seq1:603-2135(+)